MTKLVLTRRECAELIYRIATDLRFNTDHVLELAEKDERDKELKFEVDLRQNIRTLVQLLQVMERLT